MIQIQEYQGIEGPSTVSLNEVDCGLVLEGYTLSTLLELSHEVEASSQGVTSGFEGAEKAFLERFIKVKKQIKEQKELWRPVIDLQRESGYSTIYQEFERDFPNLVLTPNNQGAGGCYIGTIDGTPKWIVKPVDEDVYALNNRDFPGFGSVFPHKENLYPTYGAPPREQVFYELAKTLGMESVAPEAVMEIVESGSFFDLMEIAEADELPLVEKEGVHVDKEKFCVIERFVPNSKDLNRIQHENLLPSGSGDRIDFQSFEMICALMNLSFEGDGHMGNVIGYELSSDEFGNKTFALVKIDNTFTMPNENRGLYNGLAFFPEAKRPFSNSVKEKVEAFDVESFSSRLEEMHFSHDEINAFKERVSFFKECLSNNLTIYEINSKMVNMRRVAL